MHEVHAVANWRTTSSERVTPIGVHRSCAGPCSKHARHADPGLEDPRVDVGAVEDHEVGALAGREAATSPLWAFTFLHDWKMGKFWRPSG